MEYIVTSLLSYLLGSINTAYFIAKANGFDIRERGSKNAGASNVKVNFGWPLAILTCLCDMAKAIIAIRLSSYLFPGNEIIPFLAGAIAILGHIFPFYMGFHGGKGFASYLGMLIGLNWKLALVVMAVTGIVSLLSNYIAVGTLAVLAIAPIYYIYTKADPASIAIITAISAFIAYKHRINVQRIMAGEEMGIFERKNRKTEK